MNYYVYQQWPNATAVHFGSFDTADRAVRMAEARLTAWRSAPKSPRVFVQYNPSAATVWDSDRCDCGASTGYRNGKPVYEHSDICATRFAGDTRAPRVTA